MEKKHFLVALVALLVAAAGVGVGWLRRDRGQEPLAHGVGATAKPTATAWVSPPANEAVHYHDSNQQQDVAFPAGRAMRDGWAIREDGDPNVYLLENGLKRYASSEMILNRCGFRNEILDPGPEGFRVSYSDVVVVRRGSMDDATKGNPLTPCDKPTRFPYHPIGSKSIERKNPHQVVSEVFLFPGGEVTAYVGVKSEDPLVGTCGNAMIEILDADKKLVFVHDAIDLCVDGEGTNRQAVHRHATVTHQLTSAHLSRLNRGAYITSRAVIFMSPGKGGEVLEAARKELETWDPAVRGGRYVGLSGH